jgi:hypothetical protein
LIGKSSELRTLVGRLFSSSIPLVREGGAPLWLIDNKYHVPILEYETLLLPPPAAAAAAATASNTVATATSGGGGSASGSSSGVRSVLVLAPPKPLTESGPDGPKFIAFPSNYMLLLLLSDFFSTARTRELLHELWLSLLADQDFKQVISQRERECVCVSVCLSPFLCTIHFFICIVAVGCFTNLIHPPQHLFYFKIK